MQISVKFLWAWKIKEGFIREIVEITLCFNSLWLLGLRVFLNLLRFPNTLINWCHLRINSLCKSSFVYRKHLLTNLI